MPAPTASTPPWDLIAGQYQLQPGKRASVVGARPILGDGALARLLRGKRADEVSQRLSDAFTLCAHAHRRTSELTLMAALEQTAGSTPAAASIQLRLETARDHLRSMALDWPQRLSDPDRRRPDLDWLHDCPVALVAARAPIDALAAWDQLKQLQAWLESRILAQTVSRWLRECRTPEAFARWCQAHADRLPPATYLSHWWPSASAPTRQMHGLDVLDHDLARQNRQLTDLAHDIAHRPDFVQRPTWLGRCVENGPWTRLRDRPANADATHTAWSRMGARWLELLTLANLARSAPDDTAPVLASGVLRLDQGQALGWCEMARGLLLHWVQLDAQGRVQDYRVLAPTEWNFHPQGTLARAVAALGPHDHGQAAMLAAAFDPCVACTVVR